MTINGADIEMLRGDTEMLTVGCETEEGTPRPFEEGDTVFLTVAWPGAEAVLSRAETEFVGGEAVFVLSHEDTNHLLPAAYRYDVQLTARDGSVATIVGPGRFVVKGDVTRE